MRSMLFVPADSEAKLARAHASGADALIIDLEDSVAHERKTVARDMAVAFIQRVRGHGAAPKLWVRINDLSSEHWARDAAMLAQIRPDGVMIPKTRGGADVRTVASLPGLGDIPIVAIVTELPISILSLASYVGASSSLAGLTWGAEDLSAELGSKTSREADGTWTSPYQLARDLTLMAAGAAGVAAIDTVYVSFKDLAGLEREARLAARDGFQGKMAIHPAQVAIINRVFTPTADEIAQAQALVNQFTGTSGLGVSSHQGQMLDRPHVRRAERLLERARAAGLASDGLASDGLA